MNFFKSVSHETKRTIIADHITYDHDAKMHGIISVSTYVGMNAFCKARCNNCDNAICKYCYAASITNCRRGLKARLIRLHMILTNIELTVNDIPVLDYTKELGKAQKYSFIRFLFTVYDDNYIREHNIKINCGAKHCISCGICYKYLHEFKHGLQLINERKK